MQFPRYLLSILLLSQEITAAISTVKSRIIGGTAVQAGQYPWMVSIRHTWAGHICGGVLLNSTTILTAGHCAMAMTSNINSFVAWAAVTDFASTKNILVFKILQMTIHPNFNSTDTGISNDIAILKVSRTSGNSGLIIAGQVLLDSGLSSTTGTRVGIAGWGFTTENAALSASSTLLEASVTLVDQNMCASVYQSLSPSSICAFGTGQDSCQGDSGGPLFVKVPNTKKIVLVGITSYANGCSATESSPGVYARISQFAGWIRTGRITTITTTAPIATATVPFFNHRNERFELFIDFQAQ